MNIILNTSNLKQRPQARSMGDAPLPRHLVLGTARRGASPWETATPECGGRGLFSGKHPMSALFQWGLKFCTCCSNGIRKLFHLRTFQKSIVFPTEQPDISKKCYFESPIALKARNGPNGPKCRTSKQNETNQLHDLIKFSIDYWAMTHRAGETGGDWGGGTCPPRTA